MPGDGDTPSILAGDPEEEPRLLRLPSRRSEDRLREAGMWSLSVCRVGAFRSGRRWLPEGPTHQGARSERWDASGDSIVVEPWNSLLGWLSISISTSPTPRGMFKHH